MNKALKYLIETNWIKTIRVNFHYFPFRQAIKLPILVAHHTVLKKLRGVFLEGPISTGMLLIGYRGLGTQDSFYDRTIWEVSGKIIIKGKTVKIGRGSKLSIWGECSFGSNFTNTARCVIICSTKITFGDGVLISWDVLLMDTDSHAIKDIMGSVINENKPIVVEDNVWIACHSIVLKGCRIPCGSVIAAGSVISGHLNKPNCVYTSNQKILRENIVWDR